ncbi:MAG: hypothetical protein ACK4PR_11470 [Gammaproteobacteria bacterium]
MRNAQEPKAMDCNPMAFAKNLHRHVNYTRGYKRKPGYYAEFMRLPSATDPIFLTVDWGALNFVRRFKGVALFCEGIPDQYDLTCCCMHEIWVLFSKKRYFSNALQLAVIARSMGAVKVCIILINSQLMGGHYE